MKKKELLVEPAQRFLHQIIVDERAYRFDKEKNKL